jgi:hypothetical protein
MKRTVLVAVQAWFAPFGGPPAVSIHYDGNMLRQPASFQRACQRP